MPVKDVRDAIRLARNFALWDSFGPGADYESFEPVSVKFDETNKKWIVVFRFEKLGEEHNAQVEIDSETEKIIAYELLG